MENRKPAEAIYKKIGKNIADLRKELRITQQELAEKIDSTRQTITLYETGVRRVPLVTLIEISKVLHVEMSDLIPEQKSKKPGPVSKIRKSFDQISELKASDQKIIIDLLDSLYQKSNKVRK